MGAAFTAVEGGLESAFYNPATFHFVQSTKGMNVSFLFNPLSSIGLFKYYNSSENGLSNGKWLDVFKILPKAIVVSTKNWEIGAFNHEEIETREFFHPNVNFIEGDRFLQHHVETLTGRLRLADQVQLGVSFHYYTSFLNDSLQHGFSSSYGVFLRPHKQLDFGIAFISLPTGMKGIRVNHDRFEDETVNIGVAYHPFNLTTVTLDIRNLTEDSQKTTREFHIGLEQGFWRQVYLRSGYYRDRFNKKDRFSFGVGLLNLDLSRLGSSKYYSPNLALNYSIMIEPGDEKTRWHFFTLQWGFGW